MQPFAELRHWLRHASRAEIATTGTAVVTILAVLTWVIAPTEARSGDTALGPSAATTVTSAAPTQGTPAGGSPANQGTTARGGVGAVTGGGPGGPTQTTGNVPTALTKGAATHSAGCTSPSGAAPGVTAKQLKVAVVEVSIVGPAGNTAFAEPSPQQQHDWYQQVIDSINASGGIACRRVVPTYYEANPADQSDLQQKCLDIAASGVFAVLDVGAYGPFPQKDCYAQHHVPFFTGYIMTAMEQRKFYPYLFASETFENLYRNTIFALRDRGFFRAKNGFRKLGFVYESCYPYLIRDVLGWLHQAGVPDSQILAYDTKCPATFPTAADQEQAVATFQREGVTHVTTANFVGGLQGFTQIAQQQNFHPRYGIPDDYLVPISYGTQSPNYDNLDGAVAVTANRNGEERTSGMRPSAGTARCNSILMPQGSPPVYKQGSGMGGMICSELWLFKAAVEHAPTLSREALAAGLQAAKSVELSFPFGPNDLSGDRNTVWMNYWRVDQFFRSCSCWRVVDRTFHPSYS